VSINKAYCLLTSAPLYPRTL